MTDMLADRLRRAIRDVPDFPKPGILFKDITPLLAEPALFAGIIEALADRNRGRIDSIVGVESRGFLFGAPLAHVLRVPFQVARKAGKLPSATIAQTYALEYGTATLELNRDAVCAGERVLVIDDLLATGGTAQATCQLVEQLGGSVVECAFVIALNFLQGRATLKKYSVHALVDFD